MNACEELRQCKRLRKILKLVLKIGKVLNGASFSGFSLSNLLKLKDLKAKKARTSFLNYLVRQLSEQDAAVLNFAEEIPSMDFACRISLSAVESEMHSLKLAAAALDDEIEAARARNDVAFVSKFGASNLSLNVQEEIEELEEVRQEFEATARFYGESDIQTEQLFAIVQSFQRMVLDELRAMPKKPAKAKVESVQKNDENVVNECGLRQ